MENFSSYQEILPPPTLAKAVDCYWRFQGSFSNRAQKRVLPDGCVDLIFDLTGKTNSNAFWVGPMTSAVMVDCYHKIDLLGIRFRPGWAQAILGFPLTEITDQTISLDELGQKEILALADQILEAHDCEIQVQLLTQWLAKTLAQVARFETPCLYLIGDLFDGKALGPISLWGQEAGLGVRQIERSIKRLTGLTPKDFRSVLKFKAAVALLQNPAARSIEVAYMAGYCDQAHFTHAFKRFSGQTPCQYLMSH